MTMYAWARGRRFRELPPAEDRYFQVTADTQVLAQCFWQRERAAHPLLVMLHGLEGSSAAHYMQGVADKGVRAGFNVLLLNQRNCGGTEHLGPGLYHSGLTADADHVMRAVRASDGIERIVVAGYSLGGNLALKLAGDYGDAPPGWLRGVSTVSPVMELASCVSALERRGNVIYQWNFVRGLHARMRRKQVCHPDRFDVSTLGSIRTIRQFDGAYTAPAFGFDSAEDYYHRASAMRVVGRIRVPALIITAEDDPFVPSAPFRDAAVTTNPHVEVRITDHGGHCAFVGEPSAVSDGYWAEERVIEFAQHVTRRT
ncbi:MAG TPA: alpha/beta fold hydrolase [Vicinamibacterales bacterium]|nr:alpha/beta fold hydrolase [Vicinamibacterales bacterium]